ncbi:MAG: single-stranded DNA-binding protein [Breznakibacter sp.]
MYKIILTGNLGQDAEIKEVGSKKAINLRVAVSLDHGKEGAENTEWVRAVIWKSEGQSLKVAEYLKKGKHVMIEGVPSAETYKSKEGETKVYMHVIVKEIEFWG